MEPQDSMTQVQPHRQGPPQAQRRKRKQRQHSADIVFMKGTSVQTLPTLSKQLMSVKDAIIGLHYVWEYRSPSKSVPPHYQCKLCAVSRVQHDMIAHVRGWKHSFKYLQKAHPEKITCEEAEATKDPAERKKVKEAAAEVEQIEGRGQLRVILKEPCEVPAFKGFRSAIPKVKPPPRPAMGPKAPPFRSRIFDSQFTGECPPPGGPLSDYPAVEYGEPGFGGYSNTEDFHDSDIDLRHYPNGMNNHPTQSGDDFGRGAERHGYGRSGLMEENPSRMYPDEYHSFEMGTNAMSRMDRPMEEPLQKPGLMGAAPEIQTPPNTLLNYLDTFRIENESDAQLVLKVTQKLTDILMEYRLRSVSTGSSLSSFTMNSTSFSTTSSRLSDHSDQYSNRLSGPSRYSGLQSRYFK
ncbi:uncharacterized protein si:ch211-197h24.6 isoform X1 [Solea solea]|uniref:uncharacterized protein si:ch211-197h24.6 isoform X1 n=2 Tax=Solea solea TaxID=90069 RepID=UPI00272AD772|nr:uncharacterized protein si:ch211-197h24.6 isoform X1 [Solea solea]